MYNSKDLVVDEDLTFLSYNQTINAEFTLEEILDSPLWIVNSDNGLIKAIPLFNCDKITSSNESDKVLDDNKCVILENDMDTIVKCISNDTGGMHYHSVELYAYAPYTKLDVISEVTVYCILHDKYLNTVGNVNVDVYIDDEISGNVTSDSNGVCRFKVDQPCTVKFVYGELESNIVVIDEPQIYTLSIETDTQSLFTDESVTVSGVLMVDGEVYADQSIALYDGSSLVDTLTTDSNGEYTKTVSGLSVGTHVFRAVHAHVRSISVSVTVNAHSYSLSIVSDKQSILTSESVTISGVLLKDSGAFSGQSVDLYDGSSLVDTLSTDSNGAYEKTLTGLSVGVHTFKAVNSNAESSTISITVNEPTHTYSLSIASDKQSILTTESVTITGTLLMDSSGYSGQSIQLYDGSTLIDTLTTDTNGGYSKTISGLTAGTHSFKAVNTNAESSTITVTVDYPVSLTTSDVTKSYRDGTQFIATVTKNGEPYGVGEQVTFIIGGVTSQKTIDGNGQATMNINHNVGTYTITSTFGNLTNTNTITINKASTTTSLTASSSSILTTDTLTLSGAVTGNNIGDPSVKIYDGATLVDTITATGGSYSKSLTGLSVGTHTFKTVYEGGTNWNGSESSTVTVTVSEPTPVHDYSLSVASTKDILSYADSESATITATLTDNGSAVAGETLSYVIKHGATTIDTGTGTTDSNGEISFTYSATGVGDVTVEVDYGSLLQETYEIEDLLVYRASVSSSDTFNISLPNHFEISSTVTKNSSKSSYVYYQTDNYDMGSLRQNGSISVRLTEGSPFADNNTSIIQVNAPTTLKYEYDNGTHTISANNKSASGTNATAIGKFKSIYIERYTVTELKIKAL